LSENLKKSSFEAQTEEEESGEPSLEEPEVTEANRFFASMLDEVPPADIARICGLKESSVRTYLSNDDRRKGLAEWIRDNPEAKKEILLIVHRNRSSSNT